MADKVGSIFYEAIIDSKGVSTGAGVINKELKGLEGNFGSLGKGVLAVGGIIGTFVAGKALLDFFKSSVEAADESNRIMAQTGAVITSTGGVAGYTAEQIHKLAAAIQSTTPISDEAAQSGINMLLTFTNIGHDTMPQATQAMVDMATAMNGGLTPGAEQLRDTAIRLGKALQDPILGITALRRVGVDFNQQQTEMVKKMVETGHGMEAQQYILKELNREFGGSAAAQLDTFGGRMERLHNIFNDVQEQMGNALIPSLLYLAGGFDSAAGHTAPLLLAIKTLSVSLIGLGVLAQSVGNLLKLVFGTAFVAMSQGISSAGQYAKNQIIKFDQQVVSASKAINAVLNGETNKRTQKVLSGFNQEMAGSSKKSEKLKKDLEDETRKYETETAKRKKVFESNMADLIWAHQDKVKSIQKDMDDENRSYEEDMAARVADFKEKLGEMKDAHEQKVADIISNIGEEKKSNDEKNADATSGAQDQLAEEKKASDEKIATLQAGIEKEILQGKNARQVLIANLKNQIAEEKLAYQDKVDTINKKLDEEVAKNNAASQKKIDNYNAELATENAAYDAQVAKEIARDAAETLRLQTTHAQKIAELQTSLNTEQAILKAHQSEVDAVKDKARLDDIDRLKASFAEQNAEALANHNQRMKDIKEQATAEGEAQGGGFNAGLDSKGEDVKQTAKKIGDAAGQNLATGTGKGGAQAGADMVNNFVNNIINAAKGALNWAAKVGVASNPLLSALAGFLHLPHFDFMPTLAEGENNFRGGMAIVGEQGAELVRLPPGADIIPHNIAFGNKPTESKSSPLSNQNITIYIDKVGDQQDITAIGRELGFRAGLNS